MIKNKIFIPTIVILTVAIAVLSWYIFFRPTQLIFSSDYSMNNIILVDPKPYFSYKDLSRSLQNKTFGDPSVKLSDVIQACSKEDLPSFTAFPGTEYATLTVSDIKLDPLNSSTDKPWKKYYFQLDITGWQLKNVDVAAQGSETISYLMTYYTETKTCEFNDQAISGRKLVPKSIYNTIMEAAKKRDDVRGYFKKHPNAEPWATWHFESSNDTIIEIRAYDQGDNPQSRDSLEIITSLNNMKITAVSTTYGAISTF